MNAIIYVRVSSVDQIDGTSLQSQEIACREYAQKQSMHVLRVFVEQGESAKFADRTELLRLLDFCKDSKNKISALIVWKLDRLARNVEDHFGIKATLRRHGVTVASVTEPIAADPNGKLLETILAGFAAFDNDVRCVRTIQGLQQRLKEGLYPWKPPLGYLPPKIGHKTVPDRPDPLRFNQLQKAWQLFATGGYAKSDVVHMLNRWGVTSYRGKPIRPQTVDWIFRSSYYAGILKDPWTGAEYPGKHQAMVSPEQFARVQCVIAERARTQTHHRANEQFPLRGLVRCPECHRYLTGASSQGRSKRYPYYNCWFRQCPMRNRSLPAADVNAEFLNYLRDLSVAPPLARAVLDDIRSAVAAEHNGAKEAAAAVAERVRALKKKASELISMRASKLICDDEFHAARKDTQRQLHELEGRQLPHIDAWLTDADSELLVSSLQNILSIWTVASTAIRRRFEELLFPVGYVLHELRTAEKGLLFKILGPSDDSESRLGALTQPHLNQLTRELSALLAVLRESKDDHGTSSKAA